MVAYKFRMPAGIPGRVNRNWTHIIEAQIVDPNYTLVAYGTPVVMDPTDYEIRPIGTGDTTSAAVYGILVSPFPTADLTGLTSPLGPGTPPTQGQCDILKSGYVTVQLNGNTAAVKNGAVYVRNTATSGTYILGTFQADNTGAFLLSNAYFMGPADAAGNVEIAYNI